jgi:hypothetical protein
VRETQKIERLRLTFPSSRPIFFGEPPELNQTRFVWMEFQSELRICLKTEEGTRGGICGERFLS